MVIDACDIILFEREYKQFEWKTRDLGSRGAEYIVDRQGYVWTQGEWGMTRVLINDEIEMWRWDGTTVELLICKFEDGKMTHREEWSG